MSTFLVRLKAALQRGPALLHILIAALLLMAPTALNGRPTPYYDTLDYLHAGESALQMAHLVGPEPRFTPDTIEAREQAGVARSIGAARSAAYGVFVYVTYRLGGLWLTCFCQALVAASVIYAFLRSAMRRRDRAAYWTTIAALTLASTLPFYCGFAMPDVFTGLGAMAVVTLAAFPGRLPLIARAFLFVAAVGAAGSHTTHVVIEVSLAVGAFCLLAWLRREPLTALRSAAWIAGAAATALVMFVGYDAAVRAATGEPLRSPPFLSARVLTDGPGRRFLAHACVDGRQPFALCAFKNRRLTVGDDILWSRNKRIGVFGTVDAAGRRRLSEQDRAFALATIAYDPLGQAERTTGNVALELVAIRLDDALQGPGLFLNDGFWRRTALPWIAPGAATCERHPERCRSRLNPDLMLAWHAAAVLAALGFLVWRLTRRDVRAALDQPDRADAPETAVVVAVLLLGLAVVINAGVCGALSGPYSRYEARIIWLLPAAALMVGASLGWRPRRVAASKHHAIVSAP